MDCFFCQIMLTKKTNMMMMMVMMMMMMVMTMTMMMMMMNMMVMPLERLCASGAPDQGELINAS